jgi:hypothetical protein
VLSCGYFRQELDFSAADDLFSISPVERHAGRPFHKRNLCRRRQSDCFKNVPLPKLEFARGRSNFPRLFRATHLSTDSTMPRDKNDASAKRSSSSKELPLLVQRYLSEEHSTTSERIALSGSVLLNETRSSRAATLRGSEQITKELERWNTRWASASETSFTTTLNLAQLSHRPEQSRRLTNIDQTLPAPELSNKEISVPGSIREEHVHPLIRSIKQILFQEPEYAVRVISILDTLPEDKRCIAYDAGDGPSEGGHTDGYQEEKQTQTPPTDKGKNLESSSSAQLSKRFAPPDGNSNSGDDEGKDGPKHPKKRKGLPDKNETQGFTIPCPFCLAYPNMTKNSKFSVCRLPSYWKYPNELR